jgi:hypothetical protein
MSRLLSPNLHKVTEESRRKAKTHQQDSLKNDDDGGKSRGI